MEQPLFTRQGFEYISSLTTGKFSKYVLEQIFQSMITIHPINKKDIDSLTTKEQNGNNHKEALILQKRVQIQGVISLINIMGRYNEVLEIGCGNGLLAETLAETIKGTHVTAIDGNKKVITRAKNRLRTPAIDFKAKDAFSYYPEIKPNLVVSLHGCGNLTDRVIDLAVESEADIICVPCCYGKIKRRHWQKGEHSLPRSNALRERDEYFREVLLKKVSELEGIVRDSKRTTQNVLLDITRMMVNLDRILYLKEKGYEVQTASITPPKLELPDGSKHAHTSSRYALLGRQMI